MTTINIRVDEEIKKQATELFSDLGLDMSTAVNMFLRQSVMRDGLPFEVKRDVPNAQTLAAFREAEEIRSGKKQAKKYSDVKKMFAELEDEIHAEV